MHARQPSDTTKWTARRQFERWAHTYDRSILQRLLFRPTYEVMLEEVVGWRRALDPSLGRSFDVLDVGCGTGSWASTMLGSCMSLCVVGLDYSIEMCRRSRCKADAIVGARLPVLNGDSEHLPFHDDSFDLVTCSHSFHHYPDQAAAVREMHRVLRPGGRLILVDGFRDNVIGWVVFDVLVAWFEKTVYHAPWSRIRALFTSAGFQDIRHRKFNVWAPAVATIGVPGKADRATAESRA